MDGLTNIISKITEMCDAECENILNSAKQKAAKIVEDAKLEAEKKVSDIKTGTDEKVKIFDARALSGAELEYKRIILSEKSRILDSVIERVKKEIADSSDDVYFGYIETLVKSNALPGKGVMKMSQRDLSRLPSGFEKKLCTLLGEGKSIAVSDRTISDIGGFVIEYDEIRVDCTLSSLIEDNLDEIRDELSRALFA